MPNIASLFSSYRLLEQRISSLESEVTRERDEKQGWIDKFLQLKGVQPLFHVPPPPPQPVERGPIGITEKRAVVAKREREHSNGVASEEEIVAAAERAAAKNGGG